MIDKKTLDDAFKTKETAEKQLLEARTTIQQAASPLILSVLRLYDDKVSWFGMKYEDITKKVQELYDKRFSERDIRETLSALQKEGAVKYSGAGSFSGGYRIITKKLPSLVPFNEKLY